MAGMENLGAGIKYHVAVIGGGWAGLSAAAILAQQHIPVTVFEAAKTLGGRARSVTFKASITTGEPDSVPLHAAGTEEITLDNGQHILLGAYRETLRLMQLVGVDIDTVLQRLPLRLSFPGHFSLATSRLPAPLHLLVALLRTEGLNWSERRAALAFMLKLHLARFRLPQDISVATLLEEQPSAAIRYLWEPLCLAALNTPLRMASAQVFLNVLQDAFGRSREDSDLLLPRSGLSELFPDRAAEYIRRCGGEVLLSTGVDSITSTRDGFKLDYGDNHAEFSHVICAVPPYRLTELINQLLELNQAAAMVASLSYQPIYTVYLQYPQPVTLPFPMLGLLHGSGQWVFDRAHLCNQDGLLAVVISAEGPHQLMRQDALAASVHAQLAKVLPGLPMPVWHRIIAEKRATFACTPAIGRPAQRTPLKNFFLAGDYTAGSYPSTLEGAVRSGVLCAEMTTKSGKSG
jgi:squalene-associated FAD-dependent desaturase